MKVAVKYVGEKKSNYSRYGISITPSEREIDICQEIGCDIKRAEFIASQLQADPKVKISVISTGGAEAEKRKARVEKTRTGKKKNG